MTPTWRYPNWRKKKLNKKNALVFFKQNFCYYGGISTWLKVKVIIWNFNNRLVNINFDGLGRSNFYSLPFFFLMRRYTYFLTSNVIQQLPWVRTVWMFFFKRCVVVLVVSWSELIFVDFSRESLWRTSRIQVQILSFELYSLFSTLLSPYLRLWWFSFQGKLVLIWQQTVYKW